MKGARVTAWGQPPEYMDVPDIPAPTSDELQLKVLVVGVPRAVQGRAAGLHYSSKSQPLPFDPSVDGVGLDEITGDRYYVTLDPKGGVSMFNERVNVPKSQLVKLEPGVDPVTVAALINPVASSWMALQARAVGGCKDRTVLVVGATGTSGRAAVTVAKSLGAARVIAMSRSEATLAEVEGIDVRVVLTKPAVLPPDLGPIDIILDYVGGATAVELMTVAEVAPGRNLQYIHIGDLGGEPNILLPTGLLNKKPVSIVGSGMGSFSVEEIKKETPGLVAAIGKMKRPSDVFTAPLSDVQSVWNTEDAKKKRLVITLE
ncbi:putative quinone oxidoreductase protein [Phaeoacremonium minimum UCRPA7]|uniref:Putative quinone oxidoreductase protein n=1 Tax=Phaeoacremonium minimum (strain UCR-PA7) TaxID=1286976 RepID=R8BG95_PHAM7|nr:putative quinone oxidoreductase protein [Phaeoacremonium minimum UCRPA7]EON98328.1 putative quinone oxidoreductase protein [Phaeoacremonium minimum UCRPA7]